MSHKTKVRTIITVATGDYCTYVWRLRHCIYCRICPAKKCEWLHICIEPAKLHWALKIHYRIQDFVWRFKMSKILSKIFHNCELTTGRLPTRAKRRTQRMTLVGRWEREAGGSRRQHDWTTIRSTCTDQAERPVGCQLLSQGLAPRQSKTARPKKNFKL